MKRLVPRNGDSTAKVEKTEQKGEKGRKQGDQKKDERTGGQGQGKSLYLALP